MVGVCRQWIDVIFDHLRVRSAYSVGRIKEQIIDLSRTQAVQEIGQRALLIIDVSRVCSPWKQSSSAQWSSYRTHTLKITVYVVLAPESATMNDVLTSLEKTLSKVDVCQG